MNKIILPELGEGITRATVAYWHCAVGDPVAKDTDIVEVVTDKAVFNIPAGVNGILKEIYVQAGHEAIIGSPLAGVEPHE